LITDEISELLRRQRVRNFYKRASDFYYSFVGGGKFAQVCPRVG
jgi:hypothetical protein